MMMRSRSGFTLLELLVSIAIGFAMLGIGVGVYLSIRRSVAVRGEAAKVAAAISNAHNSALINHAPAVVTFSAVTETGATAGITSDGRPISFDVTFHAIVRRPVGVWHFEQLNEEGDRFIGSSDYPALLLNAAERTPFGRIGNSLHLPLVALEGPAPHLQVGIEPNYVQAVNLRDGIYIEAWVKPDFSIDGGTGKFTTPIVSKWDSSGFSAYSLYLEYSPEVQDNPQGTKAFSAVGSIHTTETSEGGVPKRAKSHWRVKSGEWTHVAMSFRVVPGKQGNRLLTTFINGEEDVDESRSTERTAPDLIALSNGPVRIGCFEPAMDERFVGCIDEVGIHAFARSDRQRIGGNIGFAADGLVATAGENVGGRVTTGYHVEFDSTGRLAGGNARIQLYAETSGIKRKVYELGITALGGIEPREWEERYYGDSGWNRVGSE